MIIKRSNNFIYDAAESDDENVIVDALLLKKDVVVLVTRTLDEVPVIFVKKPTYGEVKYGDLFLLISNDDIDTYAKLISEMTFPEVILLMRQL